MARTVLCGQTPQWKLFTLSEASLKGSLRTLGIWIMELSLEFQKGKEALQDWRKGRAVALFTLETSTV